MMDENSKAIWAAARMASCESRVSWSQYSEAGRAAEFSDENSVVRVAKVGVGVEVDLGGLVVGRGVGVRKKTLLLLIERGPCLSTVRPWYSQRPAAASDRASMVAKDDFKGSGGNLAGRHYQGAR